MRRFCPSLTDLQAFEVAARHSSFTRAAQELCVTQGAVSKQVKHLEAFVGVELFLRIRQGLVLTEAGRAYLAKIQAGLGQIEAATVELIAHQARRHAEPDLPTIRRALADPAPGLHAPAPGHPRRIPAAPPGLRFLHPELDAAVCFGEGLARQRRRLIGRDIVPVYSPRLIPGGCRPRGPAGLSAPAPHVRAGATGPEQAGCDTRRSLERSTSTRCVAGRRRRFRRGVDPALSRSRTNCATAGCRSPWSCRSGRAWAITCAIPNRKPACRRCRRSAPG